MSSDFTIKQTGGCILRRSIVALVFVFSSFCMHGNAWGQAQITTGSIQGTVVDEKGGAVADATVEVKNVDTNFSTSVTTGSDGQFQFLSLPPGPYTVTISKTGF